jgi:hypothetical protein
LYQAGCLHLLTLELFTECLAGVDGFVCLALRECGTMGSLLDHLQPWRAKRRGLKICDREQETIGYHSEWVEVENSPLVYFHQSGHKSLFYTEQISWAKIFKGRAIICY